jgi:hypothetical protein
VDSFQLLAESSSSVTSPIVDNAISMPIIQDARREVGENIGKSFCYISFIKDRK